jgi:oligopeptide/dipeptide ABC transporter ATP-binding protein
MAPLLEVVDLRVSFRTDDGTVTAVDGVSFNLSAGEILAVVGESGSGKSAMAMTLMGLTRGPNASLSGSVRLDGLDLLVADEEQLRRVRGQDIAMVFQNPMTSLNPVQRIGKQIAEQIRAHGDVTKREALERAVEMMQRAGIPHAAQRARAYPYEFSGGMRQRAMIAMALSCSPRVLIADEPTTALDVTIQAQVLDEIEGLRRETGVSVLLITHDLGVVADMADRVLVMYGGRVVEEGDADDLFENPQHPYTWALLSSAPRVDRPRPTRLAAIPGMPPSLVNPPVGCHFGPRCPHRYDACERVPPLAELGLAPGHKDRCWLGTDDKSLLRQAHDDARAAGPGAVPA